jgi:citrate synthase
MKEEKELFTISKKHLDTGLRGYPIGYCISSSIDPEKGIFYGEHPIGEVCERDVEEVMFLIINGNLPGAKELEAFKKELVSRAKVSQKTREALLKLPGDGHPMKLFSTAILILGMQTGKGDLREDFLNLLAKIPEVAAIIINHHAQWGETPASKPEMGQVKNFCNMLMCPNISDNALLEKFMNMFINLHMDNGGGNLATFTAKAVASGGTDIYGSFAAALLALSGAKHGGANQNGLEFVKEVMQQHSGKVKEGDVKRYVEGLLINKKLIYGFGHAILTCADPRATRLFSFGKDHFPDHPLLNAAFLLKKVVPPLLKDNPNISNPYSNIDSISGVVLSALGFDFPEYFTVLFGMSRMAGIGRQIIYETLEARDGKGVPIYRPRYVYKKK